MTGPRTGGKVVMLNGNIPAFHGTQMPELSVALRITGK